MASQQRFDLLILVLLFFVLCPGAMAARDAGDPGSPVTVPDPALPFAVHSFIPGTNSIHSIQIMDLISAENGDVLIATASGISTYNGRWTTRAFKTDNYSQGLYDNYVVALEYDRDGNLWIGYANGLQIFDGQEYRLLRDQQLLKDLRIIDLQRWNDDMWVLTGNAGIHRYHEGNWTWYKPKSPGGPGFYTGRRMAIDSADNSMLVATQGEGLWRVRQTHDAISFIQLQGNDDTYGNLNDVRRDPVGGAYFFNTKKVVHYDPVKGFSPVFPLNEGTVQPIINDIAAGPDGTLYIATNDGIWVLEDQKAVTHVGRFEGIGTSPIIKTINADAHNRIWFSTTDDVGFFTVDSGIRDQIPIDMAPTELTETPVPRAIPTLLQDAPDYPGTSPSKQPLSFIDTILESVSDFIKTANPFR
ncbi:MAG: two-component regulator propeller domain-containing protein [Methanoregula sp.]|jgi:ligand-binding sensor domain-containing protein